VAATALSARRTTPGAILDAAYQRFSHYGYRRTSIEDVARAAGISRQSVYAHFKSKEDLFRAVSQRVHDEAFTAAETALAGDGPLKERLAAMLQAKFGSPLAAIQSPSTALELLDENERIAGDISAESTRRYARLLRRLIEGAVAAGELDPGRAGMSAKALAELVADCAHGLEWMAVEPSGARRHQIRLDQLAALVGGLEA